MFDAGELANPSSERLLRLAKNNKKRKMERLGLYVGKDAKKNLQKAEAAHEKMKGLKESNSFKASLIENKRRWQLASLRAQGVKVKDDINLMKKSLKRQERKKEKSRKEWKKRVELVESKREARQQKRRQNIQSRKDAKRKKKYKKLVKKGHIVPEL